MTTPAERWKRMLAVHKRRCREILGISDNVRYAGVINAYGRTLTGATSPSARPLLGPMDAKNEFFVISTVMAQREGSRLGRLDHALLVHQKVYVILVRKGADTYYVSVAKREKDLDSAIAGIKGIVSRRA